MDYYPEVIGELETMRLVVAGASIARYGDGEFKMCEGASIKSQEHHPRLQARLREILDGSGECLVGIPNIRSATPKAEFWGPHMRFHRLLSGSRQYYSSFISRPDSAPWIDCPESWEMAESLWKDQNVTLIRGGDPVPQEANPAKLSGAVSLVAADLTSARSVTEIVGPAINAWTAYDSLMAQVDPEKRTLLCLGSTATVLAVDICARGGHAIDLGHFGMYLKRHRAGEPMKRNKRRVA